MMPAAHIGVAVAGAWLSRQKVDYRLVAAGAILPDLIDNPFNLLLFPGEMAGWLVGHSLVFNVSLVLLGLRYRWLLVLGLSSMSHILLDRVWRAPVNFFWPFMGWAFQRGGAVSGVEQLLRHFRDPATWKAEVAAIGCFVIIFVVWRLRRRHTHRNTEN